MQYMGDVMYYIEKIPTPRGEKILKNKIPVTSISGVDEILSENGFLKGKYNKEIGNGKFIKVKIMYRIKYNDETERVFSAFEYIDSDKKEFSLSSAPIVEGTKKYVTEIEISVSNE